MPRPHSSALLVLVLCGPACGSKGSAEGARNPSESAPREVRTAPVTLEPWERSVPALGELAPFERVVVATKVPGRLAVIHVDRGDRVRRGDPIAELESREYELRVQAAGAAVESVRALLGLASDGNDDVVDPTATSWVRLAQAELERERLGRERAAALAQQGIDSQAVLDEAETELRAAESRLQEALELVAVRRATLAQRRAELEIARAQLAETRIEAPFDGRVVERIAGTGAYVAAGDPLVELVRVDPLRLVLEVGERDSASVRVGQAVRARLEGHEGELTGTIARLAPALEPDVRTLVLEVEVLDPGALFRPGAFAEARIVVVPDEPALTVPVEALVTFAGLDKAYVVKDGKSEERRLALGRREPERVEVLSGLSAGETVVLAPGKLGGGTPVRAVE